MKDLLDVHTHTIASGHAYSTIRENILAAKNAGLELVGIADHAPSMPGSCHEYNFLNLRVVPRNGYEVQLVLGAELNIIDYSGSTDLSIKALKQLDYAIASLHGTVEENTQAIIGVMKNPYVVIIGHPDNPQYPVDLDKIARAAAENNVLLEINNSSYKSSGYRAGSRENAKIMLDACKKYKTAVIMGSDAHVEFDVGNHKLSQEVIAENNFPEELVVNGDPKKFFEYVNYRKSLVP